MKKSTWMNPILVLSLVGVSLGCTPTVLDVIEDYGGTPNSARPYLVEVGEPEGVSALDFDDTRELIYAHYEYVHVSTNRYSESLHKALYVNFLQNNGCEPYGFKACSDYDFYLENNDRVPVPPKHQEIYEVLGVRNTTEFLIVTPEGRIKARLQGRDQMLAFMLIIDGHADELGTLWDIRNDEDRRSLMRFLENHVVF